MNFKDDFPMLNNDLTYLDNCATTLKPNSVINEVSNYYKNYCVNAHRGDYKISRMVDDKISLVREKVRKFINASSLSEIIFTCGTTEGLNMIIKGFFKDYLKAGDEVLTTKAEHASLMLPWFDVVNKNGAVINYIELEDDLTVTMDNVKKAINKNTKVISLAHITNVIGDVRPIKEICNYAHKQGIIVLVDGAQSVPHEEINVKDMDVDFLTFSAHKMLGPTGVGVLYGKQKYLKQVKPLIEGGGMNSFFDSLGNVEYKKLPERLEAGTQNIAGILGLEKAIDYLNSLGMQNIHTHEVNLKRQAINELSKIKKIIIYNKDIDNGIITFNVEGKSSKEVSCYLDKNNICVRMGSHCAKALSEVLNVNKTLRISFYFYNTKKDIDKLVKTLNNLV